MNRSRYKLSLDKTTDIDAKRAGNEMRFINDFRNTGSTSSPPFFFLRVISFFLERANVAFIQHVKNPHHPYKKAELSVVVRTLEDIAPEEELLVDYGEVYWQNLPGGVSTMRSSTDDVTIFFRCYPTLPR